MAEDLRHTPPCDDPSCMPCWWDALDRELFADLPTRRRPTLAQRLRTALRKRR